jgi:precorrin-6B methylase 1
LARRDADVVSLSGEDSADQVARMIALAEQGKAVVHLSPGAEVPQAIAQVLREAGIQVFDVPGVALGASDGQTQALLPQEQDEARPASLLEMAFPLPFLANH